jgi:hypothetical protein
VVQSFRSQGRGRGGWGVGCVDMQRGLGRSPWSGLLLLLLRSVLEVPALERRNCIIFILEVDESD